MASFTATTSLCRRIRPLPGGPVGTQGSDQALGILPDLSLQGERSMIKCLVFDFDGVLADSNAVKHKAYFDIFANVGVTPRILGGVLAKCDGDRYQVIKQVLLELAKEGLVSAELHSDELMTRYAEHYNRICEDFAVTCREIAGVSTSLPQLARYYALYVNSDTPEESLRRIINRRGWGDYFRAVLGRPRTKVENLKRILEYESITGSEVGFVGDSQRDLDAAMRCGCRFIGVRSDGNDFDLKEVLVVNDLSMLEGALRKL